MSKANRPKFKPFPFFSGCHRQTILGSCLPFYRNPDSITRFVHLPDGDKITFEVTTPIGWDEKQPTIVMVHGLCGSHMSPCLVRMASKFYHRGIRSIRINLRGCGSGKGYAKCMYHAEMSDDIWRALQEIKRDVPHSDLILLGFSLGGNIVLKLMGERGDEASHVIKKVIAINPPIDLYHSAHLLSQHTLYERYFMSILRSDVLFRHRKFDDLPLIDIPAKMTLLEFDEYYIAPQSGFFSVLDYYRVSSSGHLIPLIQIPCHILFARDDPIVDCRILEKVIIPPHIEVVITEGGGHLGYVGYPDKMGRIHWMDTMIFEWIN